MRQYKLAYSIWAIMHHLQIASHLIVGHAINGRIITWKLCRLSHLSLKSVEKVVDGLFTSKIRYGLHLLGKVRVTSRDPVCAIFKAIQLVQNKMLMVLNRNQLKDKVSIESMLAICLLCSSKTILLS